MTGLQQDAAQATVEWWADQIFGRALPGRDAGLEDDGAIFATFLAATTVQPLPDDKRDLFVHTTAAYIRERLAKTSYGVQMGTDYAPDYEWDPIITATGVPAGSFPWKSGSWTYADRASAKSGYGAELVDIWPVTAEPVTR